MGRGRYYWSDMGGVDISGVIWVGVDISGVIWEG